MLCDACRETYYPVKYTVRVLKEYVDRKSGEPKRRWFPIGFGYAKEPGRIMINLDAIPLWGKMYMFPHKESEDQAPATYYDPQKMGDKKPPEASNIGRDQRPDRSPVPPGGPGVKPAVEKSGD